MKEKAAPTRSLTAPEVAVKAMANTRRRAPRSASGSTLSRRGCGLPGRSLPTVSAIRRRCAAHKVFCAEELVSGNLSSKVVAGLCADTHTYGRTQVPGPWESVTWEIDAGNAGRLSHGDKHQTFVDIIVKPDGTVEFNTWQGLEGEDFKITDSWTAKAGAGRNTGKLVKPKNQSVFESRVEMRLTTTAVR